MAIVVGEESRKFPLIDTRYLEGSLDDRFANVMAWKRANCPNLTDESAFDPANQILWMVSAIIEFLRAKANRIADDLYIGTTTDREVLRRLLDPHGYTLRENAGSAATITLTLEAVHPEFTVDALSQVSTKASESAAAIVFETAADALVPANQSSIDIAVVQGATISEEALGTSDAELNQRYRLANRPVVWHSEIIEVNETGEWETWTRVDDFSDSDSLSQEYRMEVTEQGFYEIVFGDGTNGKVPLRTASIRASYRKGGGVIGNVAAGTIIELVSDIPYATAVTNVDAASGGIDKESIEQARIYGPASARARDRAVTVGDVETLARNFVSPQYGGVAAAKASEIGSVSVSVMIVPASGGLPTTGLKNELQVYLDDRKYANSSIVVVDPSYRFIDIDVFIQVLSDYSRSKVIAAVRTALVNYLSPIYQDPETLLYANRFGRNIYLSDLYLIVNSVPGVEYSQISEPTGNIVIPNYQISDHGTVTVTTDRGDDVSYQNERTQGPDRVIGKGTGSAS